MKKVIRTEDAQIRAALQQLGWTPPEYNIYKDLLQEFLKDHFYVDEDGICWSYKEGVTLADIKKAKYLNQKLLKVYKGEEL